MGVLSLGLPQESASRVESVLMSSGVTSVYSMSVRIVREIKSAEMIRIMVLTQRVMRADVPDLKMNLAAHLVSSGVYALRGMSVMMGDNV